MPAQQQLSRIPGGKLGTGATIAKMKSLVDQGKKRKDIIILAREIVHSVPERDHRGEVNSIYNWVKKNVRYVNDVYGVETIQQPWHLIREPMPSEDCDGLSTLVNTLCAAVGYDTAFKTIKADPHIPNQFSHVYSMIRIDGQWTPADASQKNRPLGWEPPQGKQKGAYEIWGYSDGSLRKAQAAEERTLKGVEMNPIKQAVIEWFRRRRNKNEEPANPNMVVIEQADPGVRMDPRGKMTNLYPDEPFDPDDHYYYGDRDGYGAGKYNIMRKEAYEGPGRSLSMVWPAPDIRPWNYGRYHHMNRKFAGRRTRYHVYEDPANAVKHGTPHEFIKDSI